MRRLACLMTLLVVSAVASRAQIGDPQKGAELVNATCSSCHATRRGQPLSPNGRAPTFVQLATAPGMTSAALTVALTTPHAGMPMFMFSTDEREDIIAYILSLK
jgi:mono/diheme cytochrome c family protein